MTTEKNQNKTLKYAIIAILCIIFTSAGIIHFKNKQIDKYKGEYKRERLAKDSIREVSDGHYKKLVEDTLTKQELKKEIADLKIKADNPLILWKTKLEFKEVDKPIDSIALTTDSLTISDFYPNKEKWFARYDANIKLDSTFKDSKGKFSFSELPLNLVINEVEPGIFEADLETEEFIKINSLEVKALPLEQKRPDNFGFLAGGGINKDLTDMSYNLELAGGIRYKKVNVLATVNTSGQAGIKLLLEF